MDMVELNTDRKSIHKNIEVYYGVEYSLRMLKLGKSFFSYQRLSLPTVLIPLSLPLSLSLSFLIGWLNFLPLSLLWLYPHYNRTA